MGVSGEDGGLGLPVLDCAIVLEEIAKVCYVTAMAVMSAMGVQNRVIATYAPQHIKEQILPGVCTGKVVLAICMTDPRSEEHTSELQSLIPISYDSLCLKKNNLPMIILTAIIRSSFHNTLFLEP